MDQILVAEPPDDIERLLDTRAIAARLGVTGETVREMVKRGEFPEPIRLGSLVRWRVATFNAWIAARDGKRSRKR
jgi:prophage regulatory protein